MKIINIPKGRWIFKSFLVIFKNGVLVLIPCCNISHFLILPSKQPNVTRCRPVLEKARPLTAPLWAIELFWLLNSESAFPLRFPISKLMRQFRALRMSQSKTWPPKQPEAKNEKFGDHLTDKMELWCPRSSWAEEPARKSTKNNRIEKSFKNLEKLENLEKLTKLWIWISRQKLMTYCEFL